MVDETTDASNTEQVVICIRWIDENMTPHEDFLGLYQVDCIDASTIVSVIKDVLLRFNLSLSKCRGQCYDGCSTMAGLKSGVAKQIKDIEPRSLFTHCYGHALNLACADSIKRCKTMKDALETTHEITKQIKKSPKRDTKLSQIKKSMEPKEDDDQEKSIRLLCPTRWTVRAESMGSILANYKHLDELWTWSFDNCTDSEMKARIRGVQAYMERFEFYFGLVLGQCLLQQADSLSSSLQDPELSAAQAQHTAGMTLKTVKDMRTDDAFSLFWEKVKTMAKNTELVGEPLLPRQRRLPSKYEEGKAPPEFHESVEDMYRQIYFQAIDNLSSAIKDRFDQRDYKIYSNVEQVLLKAASSKDFSVELGKVIEFYGDDFSRDKLQSQLETFKSNFQCDGSDNDVHIGDIISYLQSLAPGGKKLLSEVVKLAKLLLVMPATNATSERSFSSLRRVKTYLRATMTQERLNSLMLLHVHKDQVDNLDIIDVANDFVDGSEHRLSLFGKFSWLDSSRCLVLQRTVGTQAN